MCVHTGMYTDTHNRFAAIFNFVRGYSMLDTDTHTHIHTHRALVESVRCRMKVERLICFRMAAVEGERKENRDEYDGMGRHVILQCWQCATHAHTPNDEQWFSFKKSIHKNEKEKEEDFFRVYMLSKQFHTLESQLQVAKIACYHLHLSHLCTLIDPLDYFVIWLFCSSFLFSLATKCPLFSIFSFNTTLFSVPFAAINYV